MYPMHACIIHHDLSSIMHDVRRKAIQCGGVSTGNTAAGTPLLGNAARDVLFRFTVGTANQVGACLRPGAVRRFAAPVLCL